MAICAGNKKHDGFVHHENLYFCGTLRDEPLLVQGSAMLSSKDENGSLALWLIH